VQNKQLFAQSVAERASFLYSVANLPCQMSNHETHARFSATRENSSDPAPEAPDERGTARPAG
jgi:hypothetical protein